MPWEEIMNQIRLFYADMLDIVNACIFVLAQWSCLMKRCRRGGSKSRRIRCLTPQWSFHSNKKNVFRNCSLVTAAHSTQHFPASAASGCVSECMQFQLFIIIFVLTCVIDLWFFFFSLWTETSFLWIRTSRRQASSLTLWPSALETAAALRVNLPPSPHHRHLPPHALHPPPVSTVPLKNKNTTYGMTLKTDVFSLLFRMWPTSRLTWSRTSLAFPKVSKTSGKCVHQRIFIFSRHVFDTWCQNGVLQVSYNGRPNISAEGSHVWNNADPLQHGVQLKNEHMGMWPYYILHRWRCTR